MILNQTCTLVFSDNHSYKIEDSGEVGHELFTIQYFMSALCGIRALLLWQQNHCVLTASDFCYYWGYYDYAISAHYLVHS